LYFLPQAKYSTVFTTLWCFFRGKWVCTSLIFNNVLFAVLLVHMQYFYTLISFSSRNNFNSLIRTKFSVTSLAKMLLCAAHSLNHIRQPSGMKPSGMTSRMVPGDRQIWGDWWLSVCVWATATHHSQSIPFPPSPSAPPHTPSIYFILIPVSYHPGVEIAREEIRDWLNWRDTETQKCGREKSRFLFSHPCNLIF